MNTDLIKRALRVTSPVFFGYMSVGIGFGLLIVNAGYPWWMSPFMSVFMFTGAGQYFAVGQLAAGASLPEIILVQLLLSLRHTFYGFSLIGKYRNGGKLKPYMIFSITDETFAIIQSVDVPERTRPAVFYTLISALDQSYWVLGTLIGAVAYKILEHYGVVSLLSGVDFALTALFIVLFIEQVKFSKDRFPVVAGIASTVLFIALFRTGRMDSSNIILASICLGTGILLAVRGPAFFNKKEVESK